MIRNVFHGADKIVRNPRFSESRAFNDFGLGFYCTESRELSGEWAVSCRDNGFISRYRMDTDGLRIIDLGNPRYTVLHWLSVILSSREMGITSSAIYQAAEYITTVFAVDYQSCDCITGYRADNSNYSFARDFMNGRMSYGDLRDALRKGSPREQFVLKSNRAFDRLTFEGYETVIARDVYPAMARRDLDLRKKVSAALALHAGSGAGGAAGHDPYSLYVGDIVRYEIRPSDEQLLV